MRKRPALFATLAVVLVGAAGATSVFFVGSQQRRNDRRSYQAYERVVLRPIATVRDVAEELRRGAGGPAEFTMWRRRLTSARSGILGLDPPSFLRAVEARLIVAVDAYAKIVDELVKEGRAASRAEPLERADDLFHDAQLMMLVQRRRLGLSAAGASNKERSRDDRRPFLGDRSR